VRIFIPKREVRERERERGGRRYTVARYITFTLIEIQHRCCIRCGPEEERILDVVPKEDGARNSG